MGRWKLYECRRCHRVSNYRPSYIEYMGDNDSWLCANDHACQRRVKKREAA